ncbi:MAG: alcohol dehydrogenase catalytic domain-containing protein, partial [Actinocatenispora sp.]
MSTVDDPPAPSEGWVLLRVLACGLCGTDVEEYTAGPVLVPTSPHPLTGRCAPLTLGHEFVGAVAAVGAGVTLTPGTTVAVDGNMWCGRCSWCLAGRQNLCPQLAQLGQQADGGLADLVLAPAYSCVPYAGIEPTVAVFAEPLSVAVRAVARGRVAPGDRVGVAGGGTIGLLTAQAARLAGAATVLV